MGYLIAAVVTLLVLTALIGGAKKRRGGQSRPDGQAREQSPFKRNKFFLTAAEQSFYGCLKRVVAGRFELFAKVRLLDVLWMPPGTQGKQKWRNTVQSKHVDFLLCDPKTLVPHLAIELDDSSHGSPDRRDRDDFVDDVLEAAGIPVLRVTAKAGYDTRALGESIAGIIDLKTQEVGSVTR